MNMQEATEAMRRGVCIRREGWGGCWFLNEDGTLCICLYDGTELGRHGDAPIDWRITCTHMQAEDWEACKIVDTLHWENWLKEVRPREPERGFVHLLGPEDLRGGSIADVS